jgi:hypothetical protein
VRPMPGSGHRPPQEPLLARGGGAPTLRASLTCMHMWRCAGCPPCPEAQPAALKLAPLRATEGLRARLALGAAPLWLPALSLPCLRTSGPNFCWLCTRGCGAPSAWALPRAEPARLRPCTLTPHGVRKPRPASAGPQRQGPIGDAEVAAGMLRMLLRMPLQGCCAGCLLACAHAALAVMHMNLAVALGALGRPCCTMHMYLAVAHVPSSCTRAVAWPWGAPLHHARVRSSCTCT